MMARAVATIGLAGLGLGGCTAPQAEPGFAVIDVLRIDEELVNILVETSGPGAEENLEPYAECVAAAYALERGFGFARPIRTNRSKTGGNWRADAVYSITAALPQGSRTIDTETTVANCAEMGLPTG